MRRLWLLASLSVTVAVCGCSSQTQSMAPPPAQAPSGLEGPLIPTPPAIQAKLIEYVQCQATKQRAPQYAVLRNKYFFAGSTPSAPLLSETYASDEEQVAIAKWEVDRKSCVAALSDYIEFFAPSDKTQRAAFIQYENGLRGLHEDLIKRKSTYAGVWARTHDASAWFWTVLAERNKDARTFMVRYWLDGQPTP